MAKKLKIKQKGVRAQFVTEVGRLNWLNLVLPVAADREIDAGKFTGTVLWDADDKEVKKSLKNLEKTIVGVARQAFGDPSLSMGDFNCAIIKDGADSESEFLQDKLYIKATNKSQPIVKGRKKNEASWTPEQIAKIKNGDYGRFIITIAPYEYMKAVGITAYLTVVQFKEEGEALGSGSEAALDLLDDLEVEFEDDEDETPKKKSSKKKVVVVEEEEEEDDEDEDEEEEEEEAPKKRGRSSKKVTKKKVAKDEDEEEDEALFDKD